MKKTIVFLSLFLFSSCASGLNEFPTKRAFVADTTNMVCVEYKIIDSTTIKFQWVKETPLAEAGGPCDRLMGFHRDDVQATLNWVRDVIKKLSQN